MTTAPTKKAAAARPSAAVLAYPDNQLKAPQRSFEDTQSAFSVVMKTFFDKK